MVFEVSLTEGGNRLALHLAILDVEVMAATTPQEVPIAAEMQCMECTCRGTLRPWMEGDPFPAYSILEERDCGPNSACPLDGGGWGGLVIVTHVVAVCTGRHGDASQQQPLLLTHSHQGTMDPAMVRQTATRSRADILLQVRSSCMDCSDSVQDTERGDTICRLTGLVVAERALDLVEYLPVEVARRLRCFEKLQSHLDWTIVDRVLRLQLSSAWRTSSDQSTPSPEHAGYNSDGTMRTQPQCNPAGDISVLLGTEKQITGGGRRKPAVKHGNSRPAPYPFSPAQLSSSSSPPQGLRLKGYSTRHLTGEPLTTALGQLIAMLLYGPTSHIPLPAVNKTVQAETLRLRQISRQYAGQPHIPLVQLVAGHLYRTATATRRGVEHDRRRIEWYTEVVIAAGRIVRFHNRGEIGRIQDGDWAATPKELQNVCLGVLFTMRDGGLLCEGPHDSKIFTLPNDAYLAEVLPSEQDICTDKQMKIKRQSISVGRKTVTTAIRVLLRFCNIPAPGSRAAVPRAHALLQDLANCSTRWYDAPTLQGRAHQLALMEDLRACK